MNQDIKTRSSGYIHWPNGGGVSFVIDNTIIDGHFVCPPRKPNDYFDHDYQGVKGWLDQVKNNFKTGSLNYKRPEFPIAINEDTLYWMLEYLGEDGRLEFVDFSNVKP